nr:MAG TPA: hypothetical protein [Caudoviricetes sp.]
MEGRYPSCRRCRGDPRVLAAAQGRIPRQAHPPHRYLHGTQEGFPYLRDANSVRGGYPQAG